MKLNFNDYVKENLKDFLPSSFQDAIIKTFKVQKANGQDLTGLNVRNNLSKALPTIYLNDFEERLVEGEKLEAVMRDLADNVVELDSLSFDFLDKTVNNITDYESIRSSLALRLVDLEESKEFLNDKPYTSFANLAITYRIQFNNGKDMIYSAVIDNDLLAIWGISKEELHKDALSTEENRNKALLIENSYENMKKEDVKACTNILDGIRPLRKLAPMYILTNEQGINGACALVYPGILEKMGKLFRSNFYLLPSSIHEFMVIPAKESVYLKRYDKMVKEINRSMVDINDTLSDHAMYYDRKYKKLIFNH